MSHLMNIAGLKPMSAPNWWRIVAIGWAFVFVYVAAINAWPSTFWFEVRSIVIHDTVVGASPIMEVDRSIKQDFTASWLVEVEKQTIRGGFAAYCSQPGTSNYRVDAELPDDLTLDWWTWPRTCNLVPGTYRVETSWLLIVPGFLDKRVTMLSNVFNVRPAASLKKK